MRSEDLVNNLAHFLRQNENATPVDLNTKQHRSDELKSTRIGKPFASPRFNPVGNLINERPTVSGCESSRNKGTPRGEVPSLKPKRFSTLCLVSSSIRKMAFCQDLPSTESKLSLMTEADLIGDLLGRITGDHQ